MLRFWDSSAVVPLLVQEAETRAMQRLYAQDPECLVWWATEVECVSAITRLERDAELTTAATEKALGRLDALRDAWHVVQPVDPVRRVANRLLRVHPLRASDAFQLGAALVAAEDRPDSLELVTLDDRLAAAARREGFPAP